MEIDRSRRSRHKLGPYFRMGVREVWTSHRTDRAAIWTPDAAAADGFGAAAESRLCPSLTCEDLARLCARGEPAAARARYSRQLARRVADRLAPTLPETGT